MLSLNLDNFPRSVELNKDGNTVIFGWQYAIAVVFIIVGVSFFINSSPIDTSSNDSEVSNQLVQSEHNLRAIIDEKTR